MIIEQIELIFESYLYKSLSGESACLQVLFCKIKNIHYMNASCYYGKAVLI